MEMIHITCSFDSKCTRFASVLMTSVFENKKMKKSWCTFLLICKNGENKK